MTARSSERSIEEQKLRDIIAKYGDAYSARLAGDAEAAKTIEQIRAEYEQAFEP